MKLINGEIEFEVTETAVTLTTPTGTLSVPNETDFAEVIAHVMSTVMMFIGAYGKSRGETPFDEIIYFTKAVKGTEFANAIFVQALCDKLKE